MARFVLTLLRKTLAKSVIAYRTNDCQWQMRAGDDFVLRLHLYDEAGADVNMQTWTVLTCGVYSKAGVLVASPAATPDSPGVCYEILVTLVPADTAGLGGVYDVELSCDNAGGTILHTLIRGEVYVNPTYS